MTVSHETIHKSLFVQARGVLKKELLARLRSRRIMRRGLTSTTAGRTRGQIIDAVSIRDRPAEIEDLAIPGQRKAIFRSRSTSSHIVTQRALCHAVPGEWQRQRQRRKCPDPAHAEPAAGLMTSLTWDQGTELAYHRTFTVATDVSACFCDPQSPSQRASDENTNSLLRQYFLKGMNLSACIQG